MNNLKKILALLVAVLMIVASLSVAFADDPTGTDGSDPTETTTTTPTGNVTLDDAISISKLEAGDVVNFYQVLVYDQNATTTGGWSAATAFKYNAGTNPNGLTETDIQQILGLGDFATGKSRASEAGISAAMGAKIADLAESTTAKYASISATVDGTDKTATKDTPEGGLYLAIITPGQAGTTYNPVFVGADYVSNATNNWDIDMTNTYSPAAMAKKSQITLEKTASTDDLKPEGVKVGDTITFTVETKIPVYNDNYTSAVFNVVDELTSGLELDTTSIKVYTGKGASKTQLAATTTKTVGGEETSITNYTIMNKTLTTAIATTDKDGYGVKFDTAYILGDGRVSPSGQDITITYDAKVTTDAPTSVNLETNTVTVNYSKNPTDATGTGKLKDQTKHYTFDIDADLLGQKSGDWVTTEVVKVGLDKNGNEITETNTTLHEGQTRVGALEGATFKLYVADNNSSTKIKDESGTEIKASQYTNDILKADSVIVSDENGRLTIQDQTKAGIRGLDFGTYYLVEETAPAGYIKAQNGVKIEIVSDTKPTTPTTENDYWKLVTYTDESDTTVTWDVWELKKYEVKINGVTTGSYTFTNASEQADTLGKSTDKSTKGDDITGKDASDYIKNNDASNADSRAGKITNTQGVELPSTGGMGTTIFYVAGSILVLAAAILLITKRRMGSED